MRCKIEENQDKNTSIDEDDKLSTETGQVQVGNAIKFTPDGGRVLVRCETAGCEVHVTVSDSGPGVPDEQRAYLFDRYWQARPSNAEGSGLGLFIAKGIVEAHGGKIWIAAAPGAGATFSFALPRFLTASNVATG